MVLNYEFPPLGGGASPVSYELAKKLSEAGGFDIDVVTMGFKGLSKYEEVNKHFRIHRVRCLRSKKSVCHPWEQATYLFTGYLKAKELIKKNKYDICHCHFIIPTGVLARRLKNEFGLPYIITSHGSDVLGYNARFGALYPFLERPWKQILDEAKTVVCPSNFLKGEILKVYPKFDRSKLVVIPNGFDADKFQPQEKKKWIFSSGRLQPAKGFQYLIQAVSDDDIGWEVHIAGDGPMMTELEQMAERSKTKVILHGRLDNKGEEYKNLIERSSIFVLASEKENASIVLLEAMCGGCAIIATNTAGCPETLGGAGLLANVKDRSDLRKKMNIFLDNEEMTRRYQNLSRETLSVRYAWGGILNSYIGTL